MPYSSHNTAHSLGSLLGGLNDFVCARCLDIAGAESTLDQYLPMLSRTPESLPIMLVKHHTFYSLQGMCPLQKFSFFPMQRGGVMSLYELKRLGRGLAGGFVHPGIG